MPAQLTHLNYAAKYLETRPEIDRAKFLRGTAFPDIRRMAGIERHVTHRWGVTLEDVAAEAGPWQAGLLLHSYLDEEWNWFFRRLGIPADTYTPKIWAAVKIAEESELCGRMPERQEVAAILSGPALPEELGFGVTPESLERWYAFIIWKLLTPFDLDAWRTHAVETHFEAAKMERLLGRVEEIRHDPVWQERLAQLHEQLGFNGGIHD